MRTIQAPGIEVHEIDRSLYNTKSDNSLTDTATLVVGFANIGQDYETLRIDSMNLFVLTYGYPTNEEERYFFYAANEVLDSRGILQCAKLPYKNDMFLKLAYVDYAVDNKLHEISSTYMLISSDLSNLNLNNDRTCTAAAAFPGSSFLNTMQLSKLDKDDCIKMDARLSSFKYTFIEDFLDYAFDTAGENTEVKITYDKLFKKYVGVKWLKDLLVHSVKDNIVSSDVVIENNLQEDYTALADLSSIAASFNSFFKSDSPVDTAYCEFSLKMSISKFKTYFETFWKIFSEALDNKIINSIFKACVDRKSRGNVESTHKWIVDFCNLSNYTTGDNSIFNAPYTDIRAVDEQLTSYAEISALPADKSTGYVTYEQLDNMKVGKHKVAANTFRIVDIVRNLYEFDDDHLHEFLGIMPVVTTAANAIFCQDFITDKTPIAEYNCLSRVLTMHDKTESANLDDDRLFDENDKNYLFSAPLSSNVYKSGVADIAASMFPTLTYTATLHIDTNCMKHIGIVVFKMVRAAANSNKVQFIPVEAFAGSLDKDMTDNVKGTSTFIDRIVNDKSKYINVFSNVKFSRTGSELDKASLFSIHNQTATSLGFYKAHTGKDIHVKDSILNALDIIFARNCNIDNINIDLVCDAGVSNIAQYIASAKLLDVSDQTLRCGKYDIVDNDGRSKFTISSLKHTQVWRQVLAKYDAFCKTTRKDCMFIADGLRQTCLIGNEKIVRKYNMTNTIVKDIVPQLKYLLNVNTSYGAGYCDWFFMTDDCSGLEFWCPPSIKAAGIYVYSDIYYNYWDAPAGINRGGVSYVNDIAFNPTVEEAGYIYKNSWNYAVSYPLYGIVLEGQKTFLLNLTAFDRVNIRRMFLKMEKIVYRIAKAFCYELNTAYLRLRFVDTIKPIFEEAKSGGGISEYVIICNDKNNTILTIENHELHCAIAVRPIKTVEFIVLSFIATPQSGTFTEEELVNMSNLES